MKFHASKAPRGFMAVLILLTALGCGRKAGEPVAPVAAETGATQSQANGPVPAQAPQPIEVTVPAGTHLKVTLSRALATDRDRTGDGWDGTLAEPVQVDGRVAWPKGAPVQGVITQSAPAGRLKGGQGGLGIRIRAVAGQPVATGAYSLVGTGRAARNTKIIGGTAALGALVGILSSHGHQGDHALGGAAIGAAAGTGLAAGTADTVIRIPAGTVVRFALTRPGHASLNP